MNWTNFQTYGEGKQAAFETLANHLLHRFLESRHGNDLVKFRVINGAGGDGGIEAYGQLKNGDIIAVQAKWFKDTVESSQITQMKNSLTTAMKLRPNIKEYIFCVPRDVSSVKIGRGNKPILNHEEKRIDEFHDDMAKLYPGLTITWWFEHEIEKELLEHENEGIQKYWFENEVISFKHLVNIFNDQKNGWLNKRYIPELHGKGELQGEVEHLLYAEAYRKTLSYRLQKFMSIFNTATRLINQLIGTLNETDPLIGELESISEWSSEDSVEFAKMSEAVLSGKDRFEPATFGKKNIERDLIDKINALAPSNTRFEIKEKLVDALVTLNGIDLPAFIKQVKIDADQIGRLFLGDAGTGKTHGLSNTVENHLNALSPAIMIQAKGTNCSNWTEILNQRLELTGWSKEQIFSALEGIALRNDQRLVSALSAGEELNREPTRVAICVDGLEEDTKHWDDWNARIRESVGFKADYPRIKYIFSARTYFLNEGALPTHPGFRVFYLPREGDVPVLSVIGKYFKHYNITVTPFSVVRGIDSLFALRLFCQLYEGKTITAVDELITAERKLLQHKVLELDADFRKRLTTDFGNSRNPVRESLQVISGHFYAQSEIEHDALYESLKPGVGSYLGEEQQDKLIDYLIDNGLLNKIEMPVADDLLASSKYVYSLPYQSIMELVMSDKYAKAITAGELTEIPEFLRERAQSTDSEISLINLRIIQNIVNTLLYEEDRLIGENGFLIRGFSQQRINELQIRALIKAPPQIAERFASATEEALSHDYKSRYYIIKQLILPSTVSAKNYFGADFLHQFLLSQPSAFQRDKVWLGWDGHAKGELKAKDQSLFHSYDIQNLIDPNEAESLVLSQYALHNEMPLIYGWCLSTLDQNFRHKLRVSLTEWALEQPFEFIQLLNKLFICNDPQIQEDLASITLGLAGKLKNNAAIKAIADWAITNVFEKLNENRDVIVRQGFRSIVERAFYNGLVNEQAVELVRPKINPTLDLIALEPAVLANPAGEIYPIAHDLAWYVIKRSYNDFLSESRAFPKETNDGLRDAEEFFDEDYEDDDTFDFEAAAEFDVEAEEMPDRPIKPKLENGADQLIKNYLDKYQLEHISLNNWAMAAGIAYMKKLGFSRETGSSYTQASHGSKSKVFTLEEKYTWLAVHYIMGYLSDFLSLKDGESLKDYSQIVPIPNPAEHIIANYLPDDTERPDLLNGWVTPEDLTAEFDTHDTLEEIDEAIRIRVENEQATDFSKWLRFKKSDFITGADAEPLLAIYNYTTLHDSKELVNTSLDARGVLIKKGQAKALLDLLQNHPRSTSFVEHIDRMVGSPETDVYSNPSDLVWMNWIGETEFGERYYLPGPQHEEMLYTVTSVTTSDVDGEHEVYIPSKVVRDLLKITEMDGSLFFDSKGKAVSFIQYLVRSNNDRQEMVLVPEKQFREALDGQGLELVWFVDHYSRKNPLNDKIKSNNHPMKTRKYFIYMEGDQMKAAKFWDARFANVRD